MRTIWKEIGTALLLGGLVPLFLVNASALLIGKNVQELPITVTTVPQVTQSIQISMRQADGSLERLDLEEYLQGVLLGEMPADFETEALKAQAVAARTYTVKALVTGGKHGDGSLCGNSGCCQAYLSPETYLRVGGTQDGLDRIRGAVHGTGGLVLSYDGGLIESTYFSCSGGRTEDARAVWGTDYPYLRSVPSPGEEEAAHYQDEISITSGNFQVKLGRKLEGKPDSWFTEVTRTPGGGVATVKIAGETWTGTRLRQLLELPSTVFTITVEADNIVFRTRGFGHRVGMSQYGADAMAVGGADFREILSHYYPGTELVDMTQFVS